MLTSSQKIEIHAAHNRYTVRANAGFGQYDAKDTSRALSEYVATCLQNGIDQLEGEKVSWEVVNDYEAILNQAIREGYRNEYINPSIIEKALA